MTNSDAFAHLHQTRASKLRKQLDVAALQLAAAQADLDDMLRANRVDDLAPGSGLAGGGVNGGDRPDPTGNTALRWDSNADKWATYFDGIAQTVVGLRAVTWARQATLAHPTPTNLCRHGDCPEGRTADRGTGAKDGTPRCHACYSFWLKDASNPGERRERDRVGQSPRRVGLEQGAA